MASSLTSSGLRSGFLFLILFALIILGVIYLLFFQQPNVVDNLNRQAFKLNFAAFKNGITLANYRFLANQNSHQLNERLDRWVNGKTGLDYNRNGFPIGTNINNISFQKPQSARDCLDVWQFVLGPLQPVITLTPSENNYWVELTSDDVCVYHAENVKNMAVLYDSSQGKVNLVDLTD